MNVQAPFNPSGVIGNAGGDIICDSRSNPDRPDSSGMYTSTRESSRSPAAKKGIPCTWSQCRWLSRIDPSKAAPSSRPVSERIPVPASRAMVGAEVASGATTTHEVWPP